MECPDGLVVGTGTRGSAVGFTERHGVRRMGWGAAMVEVVRSHGSVLLPSQTTGPPWRGGDLSDAQYPRGVVTRTQTAGALSEGRCGAASRQPRVSREVSLGEVRGGRRPEGRVLGCQTGEAHMVGFVIKLVGLADYQDLTRQEARGWPQQRALIKHRNKDGTLGEPCF